MKILKIENSFSLLIWNNFITKPLSIIALVSLIASILAITACDKSLRISNNQAWVLRKTADKFRKKKSELASEVNKLKTQPSYLYELKNLLNNNLDSCVSDIEITREEFYKEIKNRRLQKASDLFFSDVSSSCLEYKKSIEKMDYDTTFEKTINGFFELFDNNAKALQIVAVAQTIQFKISVTSLPRKAKVYYRHGVEEFQLGGDTDLSIENLGRATWEVQVEFNGKRSEIQRCAIHDAICCKTFDLTDY